MNPRTTDPIGALMLAHAVDLTNFVPINPVPSGRERRRYKSGAHPVPASEPQREDYPSRQAYRTDLRRWLERNR